MRSKIFKLFCFYGLLLFVAIGCGTNAPSSNTPQPEPTPTRPRNPNLLWISEPMEGWIYWSSIAISGETLYIGTSGMDNFPSGAEYTNGVYAIDRSSGAIKWKYEIIKDEAVKGAIVIGPDGSLYFITVYMSYYDDPDNGTGTHLYVLNPNGTLKWKKKISPVKPHFWGTASPAIGADGTIYISTVVSTTETPYTHALIALNPSDGGEIWRYEFPGTERVVWSAPAVYNNMVYLNCHYGLIAVNTLTGSPEWIAPGSGENTSPVIASDGAIYAGSDNYLRKFTPSGSLEWEFDAKAKILAQPVIGEDGTIYLGTTAKGMSETGKIAGYFYALNPDGTQKWMFNIDPWMYDEVDGWKTSDIYAPAAVGKDGTIYLTTEYRYMWALNPDGTTKEVYDLNKIGSSEDGSFGTVTYSALTIDDDGILYKADAQLDQTLGKSFGKILAIKTASGGLANSPWPKGYQNRKNSNAR